VRVVDQQYGGHVIPRDGRSEAFGARTPDGQWWWNGYLWRLVPKSFRAEPPRQWPPPGYYRRPPTGRLTRWDGTAWGVLDRVTRTVVAAWCRSTSNTAGWLTLNLQGNEGARVATRFRTWVRVSQALLLVGALSACGVHIDVHEGRAAQVPTTVTPTSGASTTSMAPTSTLPGGSVQAVPGASVSITVLMNAIAATQSTPSGRFVVAEDFSGSSDPGPTDDQFMKDHSKPGPLASPNGQFDHEHGLASVDIHSLGIQKLIVEGGHYYALEPGSPRTPTPWRELPAKSVRALKAVLFAGADPADPMAILRNLKLKGPSATVLGTSEIAGTPVVQYQGHTDLNVWNAATRLPNSSAGTAITYGTSPEATDVPVDLWIDGAGRVRRVWFAASFNQPSTLTYHPTPGQTQTTNSNGHLDLEFDLSLTHLGEPVSITPPAPNQVAPPTSGGTAN